MAPGYIGRWAVGSEFHVPEGSPAIGAAVRVGIGTIISPVDSAVIKGNMTFSVVTVPFWKYYF